MAFESSDAQMRVSTGHGTVVYVDPSTGELRHGSPLTSPPNAKLLRGNSLCRLVRAIELYSQPIICLNDHSWSLANAENLGQAG